MDYGNVYIKMCEKAKEIQREIPQLSKSFSYAEPIVWNGNDVWSAWNASGTSFRWVWLPRQDQLQEMLEFENLAALLDLSRGFALDEVEASRSYNSMEQFWLAFVMMQLGNRVWNGEDWVLAPTQVLESIRR